MAELGSDTERPEERVLAERAYPGLKASGFCSQHRDEYPVSCEICFPDLNALIAEHNRLKQEAWASLERVREERDRLREIVCRLGDAVHGTAYVGSHGLDDVLKAWDAVGRDFGPDLEAALAACRTASGAASLGREEESRG